MSAGPAPSRPPAGPVSRKIALAAQIEELEREARLRPGVYARMVQRRELRQGEAEERMARLEGAIATLKWCQEHEHEIRAWSAARQREQLLARKAALEAELQAIELSDAVNTWARRGAVRDALAEVDAQLQEIGG